MKTISDLYECVESKLGESLISRSKQLKESSKTYEIPDLIHLVKQDTSKDNTKPIGFYHHCIGVDFSKGVSSIAAYFGRLLSSQQKKSRLSFNRANWVIVAGTYCAYDPISKVDLRVSFSLPGTFKPRWIKLNKNLTQEEETQPKNEDLLWQYLSLASFVRTWCLKPNFMKYPSLIVHYELDPFNYQNKDNLISFEKTSKTKEKENDQEKRKEKEEEEEDEKSIKKRKLDQKLKQKEKLKALELIYQTQSKKLNECLKIARNQLTKGLGTKLSHKNPKLLSTVSHNLLTYALIAFFNNNSLYQKGENFFLQLLKDDWGYCALISKCMRKNGKVKEALQLLLESNSKVPESIPILKEIVKCYNLLQDNLESFSYARKIHHFIPFSPNSWKILAYEFLNQKKFNQTFEILNLIPPDANTTKNRNIWNNKKNNSSETTTILDFFNLRNHDKEKDNQSLMPKPVEVTQPIKTKWIYDWKTIVMKMKRYSNISSVFSKLKNQPIKNQQNEIANKILVQMNTILGWESLLTEKKKFFDGEKKLKKREGILNQFHVKDLKLTDEMWSEWLNDQEDLEDNLDEMYNNSFWKNEDKHNFDVNYEKVGRTYKSQLRNTGFLQFSRDAEFINTNINDNMDEKEEKEEKENLKSYKMIKKENEKKKEIENKKTIENENEEKESENKLKKEEKKEKEEKEEREEKKEKEEKEKEKGNIKSFDLIKHENVTDPKMENQQEKKPSELKTQTFSGKEDSSNMGGWSGSSSFDLFDNGEEENNPKHSSNDKETGNNKDEDKLESGKEENQNDNEHEEKLKKNKKLKKEITLEKESSLADFSNFKPKSEFSSIHEQDLSKLKEWKEKKSENIKEKEKEKEKEKKKEKGSEINKEITHNNNKIIKNNLSNDLSISKQQNNNKLNNLGYFGASESDSESESEPESDFGFGNVEKKKPSSKNDPKEKENQKYNPKFVRPSNVKSFIYNTYPKRWLKAEFKLLKKDLKIYNKISMESSPKRWEENKIKQTPINEWEMIGDICKRLNKMKEARQAYFNAIAEPKNKDLLYYCITFKLLRLLNDRKGITKVLQVCNILVNFENCDQNNHELSLLFKQQICSSIFKLIQKNGWSNLNQYIQLHKNKIHQRLQDFVLIGKYLKVDGYDR
ncbi:bud site selection protein 7-related [Anaeramoeba flamelloides]|uniref:Bud site selection protein 7-related n=1 Tax=Anaeramoeba flamelloides TaxID=1746091 RepID=A0AAV7Z0J0_9EUKA|nr:bud site selection protein 7-related [Anaeramoeba flamelloides]